MWSHQDLDHILTRYGALVVERAGTDIEDSLATLSVRIRVHYEPRYQLLIRKKQWRENIWVVNQLVTNDVSSTKVSETLVSVMKGKIADSRCRCDCSKEGTCL